MIDSVLNLLFRCRHQRLTRPVSPVSKVGQPSGRSYVVCLDCGKQFQYDLSQMRIGKPIDQSHDAGVVAPDTPRPGKKTLKYMVQAAVAAAVVFGAMFRGKKKT